MKEKNELNDIILNKGGAANNNKKIVLAVATLGIILIIVVMLMNTLSSNGTDNLPQAVLPPQPQAQTAQNSIEEPLFEEVEVVKEDEGTDNDNLNNIAQKLKQESIEEAVIEEDPVVIRKTEPKPVTKKVTKPTPKKSTPVKKAVAKGSYYVQVGSFSKYAPNKKFLKSITDKGYSYKYHKVLRNSKTLNKVLVGPFTQEKEARAALRVIRKSIESGAFLTKL